MDRRRSAPTFSAQPGLSGEIRTQCGYIIFCFGVLLRYSLVQIQDELLLKVTTEALDIPQWLYTMALTIGSLLIIFRVIEMTVNMLRSKGA